jgi:hypothetical protein
VEKGFPGFDRLYELQDPFRRRADRGVPSLPFDDQTAVHRGVLLPEEPSVVERQRAAIRATSLTPPAT